MKNYTEFEENGEKYYAVAHLFYGNKEKVEEFDKTMGISKQEHFKTSCSCRNRDIVTATFTVEVKSILPTLYCLIWRTKDLVKALKYDDDYKEIDLGEKRISDLDKDDKERLVRGLRNFFIINMRNYDLEFTDLTEDERNRPTPINPVAR